MSTWFYQKETLFHQNSMDLMFVTSTSAKLLIRCHIRNFFRSRLVKAVVKIIITKLIQSFGAVSYDHRLKLLDIHILFRHRG